MTAPQPEPTENDKVVPLRVTTTREGGDNDPQHTNTTAQHPGPEPDEQPETGLVPVDNRVPLPELYRQGIREDGEALKRPKQAFVASPPSLQTVYSWVNTSYTQSPVPLINGIRRVYGYLAVLITALLYTTAWVVQKDYRLGAVIASAAVTTGVFWLIT